MVIFLVMFLAWLILSAWSTTPPSLFLPSEDSATARCRFWLPCDDIVDSIRKQGVRAYNSFWIRVAFLWLFLGFWCLFFYLQPLQRVRRCGSPGGGLVVEGMK